MSRRLSLVAPSGAISGNTNMPNLALGIDDNWDVGNRAASVAVVSNVIKHDTGYDVSNAMDKLLLAAMANAPDFLNHRNELTEYIIGACGGAAFDIVKKFAKTFGGMQDNGTTCTISKTVLEEMTRDIAIVISEHAIVEVDKIFDNVKDKALKRLENKP